MAGAIPVLKQVNDWLWEIEPTGGMRVPGRVYADRKLVAFTDESQTLSQSKITSWKWTFGDGSTSTEQNPVHVFTRSPSGASIILEVESPEGKARRAKVWDIQTK